MNLVATYNHRREEHLTVPSDVLLAMAVQRNGVPVCIRVGTGR
jgi:hypothetical protein